MVIPVEKVSRVVSRLELFMIDTRHRAPSRKPARYSMAVRTTMFVLLGLGVRMAPGLACFLFACLASKLGLVLMNMRCVVYR